MAETVQQEMERLLTEAFSPTRLEVINDSAKHSGHMGDDGSGESHFTVAIEAPAFADKSRVERQRMVNKEKMERAINMLSKRIGFRVAPGFSERVIFRELFPRGLTLLDLKDVGVKQLNISNIAARQELRDMMKALELPEVEIDI